MEGERFKSNGNYRISNKFKYPSSLLHPLPHLHLRLQLLSSSPQYRPKILWLRGYKFRDIVSTYNTQRYPSLGSSCKLRIIAAIFFDGEPRHEIIVARSRDESLGLLNYPWYAWKLTRNKWPYSFSTSTSIHRHRPSSPDFECCVRSSNQLAWVCGEERGLLRPTNDWNISLLN